MSGLKAEGLTTPSSLEPKLSELMSNEEHTVEKRTPSPLAAHDDARALVRLIQCRQCSRPFRTPVTLPCGNSLCRQCLPQAHTRENISYPDVPGRRTAFKCPFPECERAHPASDCNIDVTLSKVMDSIMEVIAKQASIAQDQQTTIEEIVRWDEVVSSKSDAQNEKANIRTLQGCRLVATFTMAAEGALGYENNANYINESPHREEERHVSDIGVLQEMLECTTKEVDCQVCYNVMLDPVTTYCGHTLCRKCLARVLDHSLHCPVCRRGLTVPPSLLNHPSNKALVNLLNGLCPEAISARAEAVAAEEQGGDDMNVPLFVVTLGFPHMPTFLRIFEPRYRLMLRRCLEGNREFGLLMYNRYGEQQGDLGNVHFYRYGTMLHIVQSQLMSDGTSLVETRGMYRFRVKAFGTHDGYGIGSVERIEDLPLAEEERIEAEETSLPPAPEGADAIEQIKHMSTQDLLRLGHDFVSRMRGRSAVWLQQRVLDIHGEPPDDGALFPYWFASVLPISDEEKYKLLPTETVRERLKIIASWIKRIEAQRWYQSNSCRIL